MNDATIEAQLQAIQRKLDDISEEMAVARRQRQEMQELKDDLTIIARDMFNTAVEELEDIAPFVRTGDFLHLLKKILRNTNNITGAISKLESTLDFIEDARPVGKELFNDALEKLDEFDRKGYFRFLEESLKIFDNVVTHFSVDDVRLLADNIVTILETVKNLTQPEMLEALNNGLNIYQNLNPRDVPEYTMLKALRELHTPEMRRGIGFIISFLKNVTEAQTKAA
ncbi:MAG: DUF1641 domain-containing protein [Chlorobi bacterium]|nr:DUF1641 domain-containing protein [Chlorobiota bacterium]